MLVAIEDSLETWHGAISAWYRSSPEAICGQGRRQPLAMVPVQRSSVFGLEVSMQPKLWMLKKFPLHMVILATAGLRLCQGIHAVVLSALARLSEARCGVELFKRDKRCYVVSTCRIF